jgi:hypothetical protein
MLNANDGKSHLCVDCRVRSPAAETNYTLISSRHGWRLTRRAEADGSIILEWRCPACWARHRGRASTSGAPSVKAQPAAGFGFFKK